MGPKQGLWPKYFRDESADSTDPLALEPDPSYYAALKQKKSLEKQHQERISAKTTALTTIKNLSHQIKVKHRALDIR